MDITMEEEYLPWHVQRKKRGSAEIARRAMKVDPMTVLRTE
jgi:hypothetical protein